MSNNSFVSFNKQTGLSLIELMVAVTIGLFLLSGIATSYITSIKSNSNRDQASMLEDNGRLALEVITRSLEHAGYANGRYIENRFVENKKDITEEACGTSFKNVKDRTIFPDPPTLDDIAGDTITSVYYGDHLLNTDCSGEPLVLDCHLGSGNPDESARIYNSYYLDKTDPDNSLMCAGSRQNKAQVVAEGIENIQYLYGVDSGSAVGNDLKQDRFINATELFDQGLQDRVVSIQVAVLVRSLLPVNTKAEKKTYLLLDQEFESPNDRYRREVFTTTVRLRNTL